MAVYLTDSDLRAEVIRCQDEKIISVKLGKYFSLIANHLAKSYKYVDIQDKEDTINHSIMIMCERFWKWDRNLPSNCFSYFTQMSLNGLREGWTTCAGHKKWTSSIDGVFEENV